MIFVSFGDRLGLVGPRSLRTPKTIGPSFLAKLKFKLVADLVMGGAESGEVAELVSAAVFHGYDVVDVEPPSVFATGSVFVNLGASALIPSVYCVLRCGRKWLAFGYRNSVRTQGNRIKS